MKAYVILSVLISVLIVGCSTEEELIQSNYIPATPTQMGSITDCEGNQYPTVLIGSQEWMAQNLRTSCYSNGSAISEIPDSLNWFNTTGPAWCNYDNNSSYDEPLGKLYNHYVIDFANVCPIGWHVPDSNEYAALVDGLGGYPLAGGQLKEPGTDYWSIDQTTTHVNFFGRGGGVRRNLSGESSSFVCLNGKGAFWLVENANDTGLSLLLGADDLGCIPGSFHVSAGLSVRCVKD